MLFYWSVAVSQERKGVNRNRFPKYATRPQLYFRYFTAADVIAPFVQRIALGKRWWSVNGGQHLRHQWSWTCKYKACRVQSGCEIDKVPAEGEERRSSSMAAYVPFPVECNLNDSPLPTGWLYTGPRTRHTKTKQQVSVSHTNWLSHSQRQSMQIGTGQSGEWQVSRTNLPKTSDLSFSSPCVSHYIKWHATLLVASINSCRAM